MSKVEVEVTEQQNGVTFGNILDGDWFLWRGDLYIRHLQTEDDENAICITTQDECSFSGSDPVTPCDVSITATPTKGE